MLGIVDGRQALIHLQQLHGQDAEALTLISFNDIACMMSCECVWFD